MIISSNTVEMDECLIMARGRKRKEYTEDQLREAVRMYSDPSISYAQIFSSTGVRQNGLDWYISQSGLEIIRRKASYRTRNHANGDLVSELIISGKTAKEVSEQLHMTLNTVKKHMSEEARNLYFVRKKKQYSSRTSNLYATHTYFDLYRDEIKLAVKLYKNTQLSFKEIEKEAGVPTLVLKNFLLALESKNRARSCSDKIPVI